MYVYAGMMDMGGARGHGPTDAVHRHYMYRVQAYGFDATYEHAAEVDDGARHTVHPDQAGACHVDADAGGGLQNTAAAVVDHGDEADGDIRISTMTTRA